MVTLFLACSGSGRGPEEDVGVTTSALSNALAASGRGGASGAAGRGGTGGTAGTAGKGGAAGAGGSAGKGGAAGAGGAGRSAGGSAGAATGTAGPCAFSAPSSSSATAVQFSIKLPRGVRREDIALGTTGGSLALNDAVHVVDGVRVVKDAGGFASVSSVAATGRTNLGVAAELQDVYSELTGIDLRNNAHVHGVAKTAADIASQAGAVVDGAASPNANLEPLESVSWAASFPTANRGSCNLEPDNTQVIDPGSYGDIAIKSRSHLKIRSGTYFLNSLSFEPQAVLDIGNTAGPVFIYVRTTFGFSGTIVEADPTHMNFMFGVAGSGNLNIETAFRGILVAPNAAVSLPTQSTVGHVGAFFAQSLIAHPATTIHFRPFAPAEFCASDAACSSFCPCGQTGGTCGGQPPAADPSAADPNCADGACCPAGTSAVTLTSGADTNNNSTARACVVGLAGNDTLSSTATGVTLVGGTGDDALSSSQAAPPGPGVPPVRIFGGPGNDTINGSLNGAQIYGGPGNDTISAGPGPTLIAPGSGADVVSGGDGDDTFVLYSECEATPGKKLLANGGFDTLISPLTVDQLRARGLTVEGFENVIIRSDACKSDCTAKPTCSAGTQCADRAGVAVCGESAGASCQTCNDCAPGLSCAGGTCQDPCVANPQAPGCGGAHPIHCADGLQDADETDVDCGGTCAACPTGSGCVLDADCGADSVCGTSNGACFGHARSQRVCWKSSCESGTAAGGCGSPDSPCGQNCACVNGCDASSPTNSCPAGEVCKAGVGPIFNAPTRDACVDPRCPSNDPALCGSTTSVCGVECVCPRDCSAATCQNPSDGCGGICPAVCTDGTPGCTDDVACGPGSSCIAGTDGVNTCHPNYCAFHVLAPPLCGVAGAPCGKDCPACTPSCGGRQCGPDPSCGTSCGTCTGGAACNMAGQCVTPSADAPPTVPDGKGGQKPLPDLPAPDTSLVGAIKGQFSVSDMGMASYTIPIEVPPGRAGMEPALSLQYSGSRANGELGVGWHLEGLSKITRCPRIVALDGITSPIQNDTTDRFCIDGKRLETVSGTYGRDGAEYRTLIDSFAKVTSHVDLGAGIQLASLGISGAASRADQGPDFFEVRTKDGRILTYGHTQDSLVLAHNGVRYSWLLNRVEDRAGNTMLVSYTNQQLAMPLSLTLAPTAAVRPAAIAYTGHASAKSPEIVGDREVRFSYEFRSDPQLSFTSGGSPFVVSERLSRVTTFVKNVPVKNYKLQYHNGDVSQVEQIFECAGGDNSRCKAPTSFKYIEEHGFHFGFAGSNMNLQAAGQFDMNGDGIADFLSTKVLIDGVPAQPTLKAAQEVSDVVVAGGSLALDELVGPEAGIAVSFTWDLLKAPFWGLFTKEPTITFQDTLQIGTGQRPVLVGGTVLGQGFTTIDPVKGIRCVGEHPAFMLDYDQDGKDDILAACGTNDESLYVSRSNGDGTFANFPNDNPVATVPVGFAAKTSRFDSAGRLAGPILVDVDGDGLQDVVSCLDQYTVELRRRLAPSSGFETQPISLPTAVPPLPKKGAPPPPARVFQTLCGHPKPSYNIFDVDGDGKPDLLARGPDGWQALQLTDQGGTPTLRWVSVALPDVGSSSDGKGMNVGDFNGDGLADVFTIDGSKVVIWLNTGNGRFFSKAMNLPPPPLQSSAGFQFKHLAVVDYDARSHDDFLQHWETPRRDEGGGVFTTDRFNWAILPDSQVNLFNAQSADDIRFPLVGDVNNQGDFTLTGDVDGDGNTDLFGVNDTIYYGSGAHNSLLSSVVDGVGKAVTVTYGGYTTDDRCATASWPEKCLKRLNSVVASHSEGLADALGNINAERSYSYTFVNARMNLTGHGWLGFDRKTVSVQGLSDTNDPGTTTTVDYQPVARYDLVGKPVAGTTPPYLYPFAGLAKTITVDQHVNAVPPAAPLQTGFFERRTQTQNTWAVKLSQFNRPFPVLQDRDVSTFDRPVQGGINPTPPAFDDNGIFLTECNDVIATNGYGNVTSDDQRCQFQEDALEQTTTVTGFHEDPSVWLISNPDGVQITSNKGAFTTASSATREFTLTYLNGLVQTVTRAPNGSADQQLKTTYGRDDFGNINQVTEEASGELSRQTAISYDSDGVFPNTVTNAEGQTTQVRYDERWGQPSSVVDPNGIAAQISYDDFGRVAQTAGPDGSSISTYAGITTPNTITAVGFIQPRLQTTVETRGTQGTLTGATVTEYDGYGRAVRTTSDGFGASRVISEQVYDALGRLTGVTRPHTADLTAVPFDHYSYDHLQRVTQIAHSDGSSKQYQYASSASLDLSSVNGQWLNGLKCDRGFPFYFCAVGFTLSIDEEGHKNAVVTDYRGRVVRNVDGDNVDNVRHSSNYIFGAFNQLIEADDNLGLATKFQYDDYGRLLGHTDPDSGASINTYNGFDELKTSQDPKNQVRTYGYDTLGRLNILIDPAGVTQWIFDQGVNALGRISDSFSPGSAENPTGQHVHYDYEAPDTSGNRGALRGVTYTIDGTDYPISLDYDDLGRTDRIHYPNLGGGQPVVAKYLYDPSGALKGVDEVGSGTAKTLWRLNDVYQGHLIQHETFGNGATTAYGYNADRRFLEKIQTTLGSNQIQSLGFTHYKNGLVDVLTPAGGIPREYQYDNLNRLSSLNTLTDVPTGTPYTYDDLGNLVGRGQTITTYRSAQPHLIDTVGENSYSYDANGNVSSRQGPDVPGSSQTFSYTPFDLPATITNGGDASGREPFTVQFDYSADEERVVRRDPDSIRHFVTDLYQRKLDGAGTTLEERFRLYAGDRQLGEIVRQNGADKTLFFHTDHLGSTSTISDSDGAVTQQDFDPFGAPLAPPSAEITRVGFTGQDQDTDLGLTDMKGRIYDPLAGRFTTADPVMQAPFWSQGLNRYSYVFNNPINLTDPSGFVADGVGYFASNPSFAGDASGSLGGSVALGIAGGTAFAAGNIATSLLTGQYDLFDAHAGSTHSVAAPSGAPAASGINPKAPGATGQNKGGVGPTAQERPANLSLFAPERGALAEGPGGACIHNPQACILAAEAAVVRAVPWLFELGDALIGGAEVATAPEAIVMAPLFIPGDSVISPGDSAVHMEGEGDSSSKGRPSNNQAQNKQANDAVKEYEKQTGKKLSKTQRQQAHRAFGKHGNPGFHDLVDILKDEFGE